MLRSSIWVKALLCLLLPFVCLAETPYERVHIAPQLSLELPAEELALSFGKPAPRPTIAQYHAAQKKTQWKWTAATMLTLGTATMLTGVRLFNKGKNAKKIAAGDAMISIGVGVDLAAIIPIAMAFYWHRKIML